MKTEITNISKGRFTKTTLMIWVVAFLLGCGGGAKQESATSSKSETESTSEQEATESTSEQEVAESSESTENGLITLVINGNDQMRFDKEELRAKAGATVELTLNHTGQLPKQSMGHNLVILKLGTDIPSFGQKAFAAQDNEYIPEGDEVIAHTALIGGGETTTITFTAPAKGTYDFICSFPGHYALMKGKFIVE
ncbi:azurin [Fulvivirgaceae bacterium BMA12]|uniref:Azurin n=1 Tax=Agaribacillus aureus TaxID=3051825 RepID=A0ABT8L849_9BACT|nr:azurin [Fulvivirgaceae bacterium BMA12]